MSVSDWSPYATIWAASKETYELITQEVRASSDFDGPLNFMVGVYYEVAAVIIALGAPVNVLYMSDGPPLDHLRTLGVRRVTFGGHLQEAALKSIESYLRLSGALDSDPAL